MIYSRDTVRHVADWLATEFTDSVQTFEDPERLTVIFRVVDDAGSEAELELSLEALEDHSSDTIVSDLANQAVPARLRRDPTLRLQYFSDRLVPHGERRSFVCDGQLFSAVRDASHCVLFYASDGSQLHEQLPTPHVLHTSLFKRSLGNLCDDVQRPTRGPNHSP